MDHVVVAIYFVGFLFWTWAFGNIFKEQFWGLVEERTGFRIKAWSYALSVIISYAFLLGMFLGASWLVHLAIEAIDPPCIPKPAWYGDGRGCM